MELYRQDLDIETVRQNRLLRLTRQMFGFGVVLMMFLLLLAAFQFRGIDGAAFSPLNVSMSELGTYGHASNAIFANGGLFFGSLLLTLASLQGLRTESGIGMLVWFCFTAAWLALALTGLFPSNVFHLHTEALKWFFYFGLAGTLAYFLWLTVRLSHPHNLFELFYCTFSMVFMCAFLFLPQVSFASMPFNRPFYEEAHAPYPRPWIWWPAFLEWSSLLSLLLWQFAMLRQPKIDGSRVGPLGRAE